MIYFLYFAYGLTALFVWCILGCLITLIIEISHFVQSMRYLIEAELEDSDFDRSATIDE